MNVIVFDMDGTLITGSSWDLLHIYFNADRDRVRSHKEEYFSGAIDYETWMEKDIALWDSPTMGDIRNALDSFTLEPFAQEVVSQLKERRVTPCIVSAGIDMLAGMIGCRIGVESDLIFANAIIEENKTLKGVCRVEPHRKDEVVRQLSQTLGIPLSRFAAVGDAAPDISLFREAALRFAYKPKDSCIVEAADATIEDLREILDFFPEQYQ